MNDEILDENADSTTDIVSPMLEDDFKDKYYRSVADMENLKKRVEKEKTSAIKFANEKIARELLETLDNFENCLKLEMDSTIRNGIELIYKSLQKKNVKMCKIYYNVRCKSVSF